MRWSIVASLFFVVGCGPAARRPATSSDAPPATPASAEAVEKSAGSLADFASELALSIETGPLRDDASPSLEVFVWNRGGRTWRVPRLPADGVQDLALRVRDAEHPDDAAPGEPRNLRDPCGLVFAGEPLTVPPNARVSLGCIASGVDVHAIGALLISGRFVFRAQDGSTIVLTANERESVRRPIATVRARPRLRAKRDAAKSVLDLLDVAIESHVTFPLELDPRALRVEILGEGDFVEDSLQMFAPRIVAKDTCAKDALCMLLAQAWRSTHPADPVRPVFDPNDLAPVVLGAQSTMNLPVRGTFGPAWEGRLPRLHESPLRAVLEVVVEGRLQVFTSSWVRLPGT